MLAGTDDKARFLQTNKIRLPSSVLKLDKLHGRLDLARASAPVRLVTPNTLAHVSTLDRDGIDLGPNAFLGVAPTDRFRANK